MGMFAHKCSQCDQGPCIHIKNEEACPPDQCASSKIMALSPEPKWKQIKFT